MPHATEALAPAPEIGDGVYNGPFDAFCPCSHPAELSNRMTRAEMHQARVNLTDEFAWAGRSLPGAAAAAIADRDLWRSRYEELAAAVRAADPTASENEASRLRAEVARLEGLAFDLKAAAQ